MDERECLPNYLNLGRAARIRRNNCVSLFRARSCSQIRSTRQPRFRSVLLTSRSRCTFRASLAFQNATRVFGVRAWRRHPCQKQPSTKTASLAVRKTKSGLPSSDTPRRQPKMSCFRSKCASRCSVLALPVLRTLPISALRFALVRTSTMFAQPNDRAARF